MKLLVSCAAGDNLPLYQLEAEGQARAGGQVSGKPKEVPSKFALTQSWHFSPGGKAKRQHTERKNKACSLRRRRWDDSAPSPTLFKVDEGPKMRVEGVEADSSAQETSHRWQGVLIITPQGV